MAGLGTALAYAAAGMAEGWGKGQMDAIKQTREEKLRQLELDRAERIEGQRQKFQGEQSAMDRAQQAKLASAQLAATKENTMAQLGVQERIATNQEAGINSRTDKTIAANAADTDKRLSASQTEQDKQIAATGANLEKTIGSEERRTKATLEAGAKSDDKKIAAQKDLQTQAETAASRLNAKLTAVTDPDDPSKTIYRLVTPDGTAIDNPVVNGKEVSIIPTVDDSDDLKSVKGLMLLGLSKEDAVAKVYQAKNSNRDIVEAGLLRSVLDGVTTFKNLTPEDTTWATEEVRKITDGWYGPRAPAPGTPAAATTTPVSAADKAEVLRAVKDAVAGVGGQTPVGRDAAIKYLAQKLGITPEQAAVEAKAAGI
jgi:hypothetical protein